MIEIHFTGEMKATIHADVLEEEGEALASGSTLVLRKVCVRNDLCMRVDCWLLSLLPPSLPHSLWFALLYRTR